MAAEKELRKLTNEIVKDPKFVSTMASKKINGLSIIFMPLHFGGVFEVMIKAAKEAVVTMEKPDVTDEELMTVFTRTEALINFRPLTY